MKIAIALNKEMDIQQKHFGDASVYQVYEFTNNEIIKIEDIKNIYQDFDEVNNEHGKKGKLITEMLLSKNICAVVSKQFGQNVKIVSQKYMPIIASNPNLNITIKQLNEKKNEIIEIIESKSKKVIRLS